MDSVQEIFTAKATTFMPNDNSAEPKTVPVNQEIDDGSGPNGVFYCVIA